MRPEGAMVQCSKQQMESFLLVKHATAHPDSQKVWCTGHKPMCCLQKLWEFLIPGTSARKLSYRVPTGHGFTLFREYGQFFKEDGCLDCIHAAVDPHQRVLVFNFLARESGSAGVFPPGNHPE